MPWKHYTVLMHVWCVPVWLPAPQGPYTLAQWPECSHQWGWSETASWPNEDHQLQHRYSRWHQHSEQSKTQLGINAGLGFLLQSRGNWFGNICKLAQQIIEFSLAQIYQHNHCDHIFFLKVRFKSDNFQLQFVAPPHHEQFPLSGTFQGPVSFLISRWQLTRLIL